MTSRAQRIVAVLTVLGAVGFLFRPIFQALLLGEDAPWFEWDVPEQYWPDLVYVCRSLHHGSLPLWNPYDRGGYPFYADPQAAPFHPITWASCAIGGAEPVQDWAVFRVLLGFVLAGLFGLLWLRRLDVPWAGAIPGAIVILAAPFMRHNWELNLTLANAFVPLMLWAADRAVIERHPGDGALLAVAVALNGWVGSPPALYLGAGLTALYVVFRLPAKPEPWRALPALGIAAILTAGLLAVVLVPTAQLAAHSVQAGRDLESISQEALRPGSLVALLWPQPGHHLYVGWLAIALSPLAFVAKPRGLASFALAAIVLAVLMTLGTHTPIFELAYRAVPGVSVFRLPHRYEAWLGPAFALLLGLAVKVMCQRATPPSSRAEAIAGGVLVLAGLVFAALAVRNVGALVAAGGLLLAVRGRMTRAGSPWLSTAPVGAALASLVLLDLSASVPDGGHLRAGPLPVQADARLLEAAPGNDHTMMEFGIALRGGTRHERPDLRGYQDPLSLASWSEVVHSLAEAPALAPQFNVRYVIAGPHYIHGWNRHFLPHPDELRAALRTSRRLDDDRERTVTELVDALPPAYFVPATEVERAPDRSRALARVRELAPSAIAVLEGTPTRSGRATRRRPAATAIDFARNADALRFVILAPSDGVVVVEEAFYPGWVATVDGAPTPVLRANGFVRAVRVGPGRHEIRMVFAPPDGRRLRVVLALSLWLVLALLTWMGLTRWRRELRWGRAPR
ncbi:MAG: hypothetical protein AB7S26_32160 [Sandaracinaceae bacterium]